MFLMSFKIEMGLLLGTDNGTLCYKQLKEAMRTKQVTPIHRERQKLSLGPRLNNRP